MKILSIICAKDKYSNFINGKTKRYIRQLFYILIVSSCMNVLGTIYGFSAILPKVQMDKSLKFSITNDDFRWLISCIYVTAVIGNMIGGILSENFGVRKCLMVAVPLSGMCMASLGLQQSKWILYVIRIFSGLLYGLVNTWILPLVTELCESNIRGIASFIPETIFCFSSLCVYICAYFLPWKFCCLLCGIVHVPIFLLLTIVPESPYWLMKNNKMMKAESSLLRLLGHKNSDLILGRIKDIQSSLDKNQQASLYDQAILLKKSQNWKPLLLVSIIMILREVSGKISVFVYTIYVFQKANVFLDPFLCGIIVCAARFVGTVTGTFIIDIVGRKSLLVSTILSCGLSITITGICLFINPAYSWAKMVPLVCVVIFSVSYNIGVSPIPWALMGELLPTPVKSISSSIVCVCFSLFTFIMSNIFPLLVDELSISVCFMMFGFMNFIFAIIVYIFLPETKGKNLLELEDVFKKIPKK